MYCLIHYNDRIYNLDEELIELDPNTWTFIEYNNVLPDPMKSPGKCVGLTIDNVPGILVENGYWLNLETGNHTQLKALPCSSSFCGCSDPLWTFNDKPTVFGQRQKDGPDSCKTNAVKQYHVENDTWTTIGFMLYSRVSHTIIEVPDTWCDEF